MLGVNTPRWCKMVSWKYSNLASGKVQEDLLENHQRACSKTHIQSLSYEVGQALLTKSQEMTYAIDLEIADVKSISVGMDGAMLCVKSEGYREAMAGTLSLIGDNREVLHTIYVGASPQYGKETFDAAMRAEIAQLKAVFADTIPWTGLADGAAHNWVFLQDYVGVQIVDFYHAWQYLAAAFRIMYQENKNSEGKIQAQKDKLLQEENRILKVLKKVKNTLKKCENEQDRLILEKTLTYVNNHKHQMNYAKYLQKGFLIGSGVTESACKSLIKSRFCGSGMQWKLKNTAPLVFLRALVLTQGRWKQTWHNNYSNAA